MDRSLAPVSQVEEPWESGERRFGDRALNVEKENGFCGGRPPFGQAEPSVLAHPLRALSHVAVSDEVDIGMRFVGRPVLLKVEQEARPVPWEAVAVEILDGERESVVDTDDGRSLVTKLVAKPLGETSPRPVSPRAGRGLNLFRFATALGNVNSEPLATGVCGLRAGVVDTDVACELEHVSCSPAFQLRVGMVSCFGTRIYRQMRLQWIRIQLSLQLTPKSGSSMKFVRSCPASTMRHL